MKLKFFWIFLIIILNLLLFGNGERTKDKMYIKVDSSNACFRRLNATHQSGCTSKRGGSTGVVHFCESKTDIEFILKNGSAGPYIPVIPISIFKIDVVNILKSSTKVNGLVLYQNNVTLDSFTHDDVCPNERYGLGNTCGKSDGPEKFVWNPKGTGMLYHNIPFPMFYVEKVEDIANIKICFQKFNNFSYETQRDRSLCSLHLKSFMYATTNTPTCIRRSNLITNLNPVKLCDPMGDQNVWATLFPLVTDTDSEPIEDQKYVVIAARLDTISVFGKTTGADSPVTGLVTLFSVAKMLKRMTTNETHSKNVLFLLLNGETFDYMGSQRLLYDMQNDNFPLVSSGVLPKIRPNDIAMWIELSQLSRKTTNGSTVFVHFIKDKPEIKSFVEKLNSTKGSLGFDVSEGTLPPASIHSFLRRGLDTPAVVLTNHKAEFTNRFYNSLFDNESNINYTYVEAFQGVSTEGIVNDATSLVGHVIDVAKMVAMSVCESVVTDTKVCVVKPDHEDFKLANKLFHCYLEDPNCEVFEAVHKYKYPKSDLILYVGVNIATNFLSTVSGLALGWLLGDIVGESNENCTSSRNYAFRYYNMSTTLGVNSTMCYRTTMNFTDSTSPAFIITDYDWASETYSSWTESTWDDIGVKLFLKPSAAHENMTIAIGSITLIFSFIFVYFVKSRSDILFRPAVIAPLPADC